MNEIMASTYQLHSAERCKRTFQKQIDSYKKSFCDKNLMIHEALIAPELLLLPHNYF